MSISGERCGTRGNNKCFANWELDLSISYHLILNWLQITLLGLRFFTCNQQLLVICSGCHGEPLTKWLRQNAIKFLNKSLKKTFFWQFRNNPECQNLYTLSKITNRQNLIIIVKTFFWKTLVFHDFLKILESCENKIWY